MELPRLPVAYYDCGDVPFEARGIQEPRENIRRVINGGPIEPNDYVAAPQVCLRCWTTRFGIILHENTRPLTP